MNRSSLIRNAAFALPVALAACSGTSSGGGKVVESQQTRATPTISDSDLSAAATGSRDLGIDLYKQIATKGGNIFLSPHSISEALTMVYAGAATNTASQLRTVLHAQLPDAQLFPAMNGLDLALESRGQGQPVTTVASSSSTSRTRCGARTASRSSSRSSTRSPSTTARACTSSTS